MAQIKLDTTGNTSQALHGDNINKNFTDLYGGAAGTITALTSPGPIGSVAASTIAGTTLSTTSLATLSSAKVDSGTKTATASSGAATLAKSAGIITTESLSTAAGSDYTLALTNSTIVAGDQAFVSIDSNGSAGLPLAYSVKTTTATLTVIVRNIHASAAFNAALKIAFVIFRN